MTKRWHCFLATFYEALFVICLIHCQMQPNSYREVTPRYLCCRLSLPKSSDLQLEGEVDPSGGYADLLSESIRETQRKTSRNSVESSLTLMKPLPSQSGTYRCQALNGLDNDSRTVDVIIQGKSSWKTSFRLRSRSSSV